MATETFCYPAPTDEMSPIRIPESYFFRDTRHYPATSRTNCGNVVGCQAQICLDTLRRIFGLVSLAALLIRTLFEMLCEELIDDGVWRLCVNLV